MSMPPINRRCQPTLITGRSGAARATVKPAPTASCAGRWAELIPRRVNPGRRSNWYQVLSHGRMKGKASLIQVK